jgi:Flp pilus assembly protein TadD
MTIGAVNRSAVLAVVAAGLFTLPSPRAEAGLFKHHTPAPAPATINDGVAAVQRALDEDRLADAGKILEEAAVAGATDLRFQLLSGQLSLARGHYEDALASYKRAEADPRLKAQAEEGQGVALSLLGRSDEAFAVLQKAVAANPAAWRAWNALGGEYDTRRQWGQAEAAYERAIDGSHGAAIVLNNRGFSRLLQRRLDEAVKDFVDALHTKPDLAAARTNLRIAMAMRGEYGPAIAGVTPDSEAATLNNAGFAAMLSGDYATAEDLFQRAMNAKGEFYARASTNLQLARELQQKTAVTKASPR